MSFYKQKKEYIILETAVQGDKVMQGFESESFLTGGDHSQMVKAPPVKNDSGSKDCVNLSPSTAVSRIIGLTKFFLTLTGIFGLTVLTPAFATEMCPLFLQRQDGTVLEGYFSPPSTIEAPIIFAIQGSSCESALEWHRELSDQVSGLGLGVLVLEKQGISRESMTCLLIARLTASKTVLKIMLCVLKVCTLFSQDGRESPFFGVNPRVVCWLLP